MMGGVGYGGKVRRAAAGARAARRGVDAAGHRHRARRVEVVGEPVGARRRVHAEPAAHGRGADGRIRMHAPQAGRDRAVRRARASQRIGTLSRAGVPRARRRRCTPARAARRDGEVRFANSDPRMILRLRHAGSAASSTIDESRLRMRLYLHDGLDLDAAIAFWSELTGIPPAQFTKPYRAVADPTIRRNRSTSYGCPAVVSTAAAARIGVSWG